MGLPLQKYMENLIDNLRTIMKGEMSEEDIISLLSEISTRGETEEELFQAAQVMREFAVPFSVNTDNLVDTCGTGGDERGTFNLSTAAAFVVAGAGVRVAKHGNRAVSSKSGSADVLEKLGVRIDVEPVVMRQALAETGIAFLFAPRYHPAMKHVAAARRKLGKKTIFNLLGPLTNPARPLHQVVGVYEAKRMSLLAGVFGRLGAKHVLLVHGDDGLDEVTLTGKTQVVEWRDGKISEWSFDPRDQQLDYCPDLALQGRDAEYNALLLKGVLEGFEGPLRNATILNAAFALVAADRAVDVGEGMRLAEKSIDTGEAFGRLKRLIEVTNQ